jgi:hypothetical protein
MTVGANPEAYLTFGELGACVTEKTAESITTYTPLTTQILQKQL